MEWCTEEKAFSSVLSAWTPRQREELVPLTQARGRIAAHDIYAKYDLPPWRTSEMDGIAVHSRDFNAGMPDTNGWTEGKEYVRADTGDDFPDGYDAVILIEDVIFDESGKVSLTSGLSVNAGDNVTRQGSLLSKNDLLVHQGTKLLPMDMSLLAMGGIVQVPVRCRPRVTFIPTGSELVPVGQAPKRGENIDSNSILVQSMLEEWGAEVFCADIVHDIPNQLEDTLLGALKNSDIVIMNGGSSKGQEDFNGSLMRKLGQEIVRGVFAAPGGPMGMAIINDKLVINLPGPAFAAFHVMLWCVQPLISYFLGLPFPKRETVQAVLNEDLTVPEGKVFMCHMKIERAEDGSYTATHIPFEGVSLAESMSTNGIYFSPIGESELKKGDPIEVELMRERTQLFPFSPNPGRIYK